jgi:hypothetical protein
MIHAHFCETFQRGTARIALSSRWTRMIVHPLRTRRRPSRGPRRRPTEGLPSAHVDCAPQAAAGTAVPWSGGRGCAVCAGGVKPAACVRASCVALARMVAEQWLDAFKHRESTLRRKVPRGSAGVAKREVRNLAHCIEYMHFGAVLRVRGCRRNRNAFQVFLVEALRAGAVPVGFWRRRGPCSGQICCSDFQSNFALKSLQRRKQRYEACLSTSSNFQVIY